MGETGVAERLVLAALFRDPTIPLLQTLTVHRILTVMGRANILDGLSRRAPMLVAIGLCASLLGYWTEAALALPYGLAIALSGLALILMGTRGRPRRLTRDPDSVDSGWLAHELAGNGSPAGTYVLGFFDLLTIALTGFQGVYALPGWAALALTAAWAVSNAHYPSRDEPEI